MTAVAVSLSLLLVILVYSLTNNLVLALAVVLVAGGFDLWYVFIWFDSKEKKSKSDK